MRVLLGVLVAAAAWGCSEPRRFELIAGSGELGGALVYRLDQESGAVCAFRPLASEQKPTTGGLPRDVWTGFMLLGCAGAAVNASDELARGPSSSSPRKVPLDVYEALPVASTFCAESVVADLPPRDPERQAMIDRAVEGFEAEGAPPLPPCPPGYRSLRASDLFESLRPKRAVE